MPYKFGEYVSTYVDPQSVRISETLRERFLSNFQANDQLTMAVEQMQAASAFENDVTRKKELQRQTENALAQLAERGDYENLGFQIHRTAKQFAKDYAPIEENYKRYQGALQEVSKAYEKGDVNAEYAQLYKNYMTRGYKGFEIDEETGRPKEGTMFSAPGIVKDPKVFDRIKKAIEIIKPEKYANKNMNVAQGQDGMYKVTVEGSSEGIDPKVVQKAINMVMDEPDVKAYVGQMSDMQAYNLYSQGRIPEVLQNQASTISSNIDNLTKAIESGKLNTATKKQYINTVAKLRSELDTINNVAQDEQASYQYVSNRIANDMFRPMEEFVLEAASYQNVSQSRMIDYDQKWLQDRKAAIDAEAALGASIFKYGEVTAADNYGVNLAAKEDNLQSAYNEMLNFEKLSKDESLSDKTRDDYRKAATIAKNRMNSIRQQIELAGNKISMQDFQKIDKNIVNALQEAFPWATTPGQLFLKLQDALRNPSDSNGEFVKLRTAFENKTGESLTGYIGTKYQGTMPGVTGGAGERAGAAGASLAGIETPRNTPGSFEDVLSNFESSAKIDYNFTQIKESNLFNYGKLDLGDSKLTVAMSKAADEYFLGKPIGEDQVVMDVTSSGIQQISGKELTGYQVIKRGWDKINNVWELELVDGKGNVKTVHYDGNNIQSPALQQIMNEPDVQFARVAADMNTRTSGEKGKVAREIGVFDKTGTYTNTKIILESEILNNGDQVFSLKDLNGNMIVAPEHGLTGKKYKMNDPVFKEFVTGKTDDGIPILELIN